MHQYDGTQIDGATIGIRTGHIHHAEGTVPEALDELGVVGDQADASPGLSGADEELIHVDSHDAVVAVRIVGDGSRQGRHVSGAGEKKVGGRAVVLFEIVRMGVQERGRPGN